MTDSPKRLALNLGCGPDYRTDLDGYSWTNVDNGKCKVDFWCDISNTPWVFGDDIPTDMFDRIDAIQVLEHVSKEKFVDVVRAMYRASKYGAEWNIASPHGFSDNFITDPTHKMPFSLRTFDYFVDGTPLRELGIIYGWDDIHLRYIDPPTIDGNQSVIFKLRAIK